MLPSVSLCVGCDCILAFYLLQAPSATSTTKKPGTRHSERRDPANQTTDKPDEPDGPDGMRGQQQTDGHTDTDRSQPEEKKERSKTQPRQTNTATADHSDRAKP
jgi:hypothetical protein